jgi:peptidoglycan/LPS O-acetylase OafA/YrhL
MPWGKAGMFVFNGGDGVSLFFVLSGLVLSLRYFDVQNQEIHYPKFIFARIFRLFPAFLVMLAIYYGYVFHAEVSFFFNWLGNTHKWLEESVLIRDNHNLFLPDWTLGVELAVSFIVPILVIVARHNIRWVAYLALIVLVCGKGYYNINIFHFCLGVMLAFHFETIQNIDFKTWKIYPFRYLLYVLLFLMYNLRHIVEIYPLNPTLTSIITFLGLDWFYFSAISAAIFLMIVINNKWLQRILSIKPLVFLGKISYGVYLTHWLFINYLLMPRFDYFKNILGSESKMFFVFLSITILGTLILSTILYYMIELPSIKLGRKWTNRLFS